MIIFFLIAVSLTLKSTQINEIVDGMNSIHITYDRGSNMADVNLQIRKLWLLSQYLLFFLILKRFITRNLLNLNGVPETDFENTVKKNVNNFFFFSHIISSIKS